MAALAGLHPWGASPLHGPTVCFVQRRARAGGLQRTVPGRWWSGGGVNELSLGNSALGRCGKVRSWCVSTRAAQVQSAEELREQLEALQQEAEQVRGRANSARLRFMRLSHVVEQLRQRAGVDLRMGKEDSARRLLTEKQKVMKALESARTRAELLEQLAGKLNVAISMKETVLIEVLSSAPLSRSEATDDTAVHHVSPRTEGGSEESVQSGDGVESRAGLNLGKHQSRDGLKSGEQNVKGNEDHNLE